MKSFLSGKDVNLTFRYGNDQTPVIPTQTTVSYTVLDHSGDSISGLEDVPVTTGPADFQSTITIPAVNNTIDLLKDFERRTVLIEFESNGKSFTQTESYRLLSLPKYTATPADVRSFLGVNEEELPDEDVDMYAAYLLAAEDFTPVVLDAALQSGTINEVYANDCIAMQAVFSVIQSLKNRVAQSEKNGIMGFDRPTIKDFSDLLAAAWMRYNRGRGILLDLIGTEADVTLIVVTQDADPVTGA